MHCKSLWIKASAKCINVNVKKKKKTSWKCKEEILFLKRLLRARFETEWNTDKCISSITPPPAGDTVLRRAPRSLGSALNMSMNITCIQGKDGWGEGRGCKGADAYVREVFSPIFSLHSLPSTNHLILGKHTEHPAWQQQHSLLIFNSLFTLSTQHDCIWRFICFVSEVVWKILEHFREKSQDPNVSVLWWDSLWLESLIDFRCLFSLT